MTNPEVAETEAELCVRCPHCGHGQFLRDAKWIVRTVSGHSVSGEMTCEQCGEAILVRDDHFP